VETEEKRFEREQNERDVLEALGEYKCDGKLRKKNVAGPFSVKYKSETFVGPKN
jgi:hypothetical protein